MALICSPKSLLIYVLNIMMLVQVSSGTLTVNPGLKFHLSVATQTSVHNTSEYFVGLGLESELIRDNWKLFNLKSPRLQTLVSALSSTFLRVGGSTADFITFNKTGTKLTSNPVQLIRAEDSLVLDDNEIYEFHNYTNFTMTGTDWVALLKFTQDLRLHLLFDLNVLIRKNGHWDSTNAEELLDFTIQQNLTHNLHFQLGNEPNSFNYAVHRNVTAKALGHDFLHLYDLLRHRYKQHFAHSLIVGPDVTQPRDKSLKYLSENDVMQLRERSLKYLSEFLPVGGRSLNAVSWHEYYLNGKTATLNDFINVDTLNLLGPKITEIQKTVSHAGYSALPVWLGESGSAYGGGARGLSDRFVAGFLWLDKLGLSAARGLWVVVRWTLFGGNYALLDKHYNPRPDYWLTLLYRRLVGPQVLSVSLQPAQKPNAPVHLRTYCHCTSAAHPGYNRGSITLFVLNLYNDTVHLTLDPGLNEKTKDLYWLTPHGKQGLKSKHVNLNGDKLMMTDTHTLPPLPPVHLAADTPIKIKPLSFGFIVVPDAKAKACL